MNRASVMYAPSMLPRALVNSPAKTGAIRIACTVKSASEMRRSTGRRLERATFICAMRPSMEAPGAAKVSGGRQRLVEEHHGDSVAHREAAAALRADEEVAFLAHGRMVVGGA